MDRDSLIDSFLAGAGWGRAERVPLAGDASLRRYWRLRRGADNAVLMDAPPPHENVRPFIRVGRLLAGHGVSVPAVLAADEADGFVLLEDFGDGLFGRVLAEQPGRAAELYTLATNSLIALQKAFVPAASGLPAFDDARAVNEACRVLEWLWPALHGGQAVPADVEYAYRHAWSEVLPAWRGVPDGFIHFDFFVDNLILAPGRTGTAACGWLDYQDAVVGPMGFDLMSLLQDVRRDVPPAIEEAMVARWLAAFPEVRSSAFAAAYAVGGAQRQARILGTFVRLWKRDGKPGYLKHLPRVWALLERDLAHPALMPVRAWFDRHFRPAARRETLPGAP
jgi:aminoglycoside/choline kinase family phosphotransferase